MRGFDLESGGFICSSCKVEKPQLVRMGGEIWGVLRFLDTCLPSVAPRISVNPTTGKRIEVLFLLYFKYHLPGLGTLESWKLLPEIYWGMKSEE